MVVSATGARAPPLVLFKGKAFMAAWKQNNPLEATYVICLHCWLTVQLTVCRLGYSLKGWIDGTITPTWITKFAAQTNTTAAGCPQLLLVDGHASHYSRAFLERARELNIHVLCYPANTTHMYQAVDVSLFGPLKAAFAKACDLFEWTQHEAVSKTNFLGIVGTAVLEAFTPEKICASMADAGTWPINPSVMTPGMLAPSCKSSWQTHMPLPPPTPVRRIAQLLRLPNSTLYTSTASPKTPPLCHSRAAQPHIAVDPDLIEDNVEWDDDTNDDKSVTSSECQSPQHSQDAPTSPMAHKDGDGNATALRHATGHGVE